MSALPTISLVTISYNQGRFLEKTIRSVLDQDYPSLQYIIIDGGSTDNSVEIIRRHEARLACWVSEKDRGQSHALNKGFSRCSGELMGWLNSDDYLLPGALRQFAEAWRKDPAAAAWVGNANLVDEAGRVVKVQEPGRLEREALVDWEVNGFSQPACLFSRRAWQQAPGIDESLFIAMDYDLWIKLAGHGPFRRIPAVLAAATIHPSAKTQAYVHLKHVETWMVMMRYGYEAVARQRMLEAMESAESMRRKVNKLTQLPFYRAIRPLVKSFLGQAGKPPSTPT